MAPGSPAWLLMGLLDSTPRTFNLVTTGLRVAPSARGLQAGGSRQAGQAQLPPQLHFKGSYFGAVIRECPVYKKMLSLQGGNVGPGPSLCYGVTTSNCAQMGEASGSREHEVLPLTLLTAEQIHVLCPNLPHLFLGWSLESWCW